MRMLLTLAELGRAAGGFEAVLLARPGDGVIPAPRGPRTYFICTGEVNSPGIKVLDQGPKRLYGAERRPICMGSRRSASKMPPRRAAFWKHRLQLSAC